jgi:hypothetical protein
MHIQKLLGSCRWLLAMAFVAFLSACGGGGGCQSTGIALGALAGEICKNNQTPASTAISGVAAGGAPIIGNVEITDQFGVKRGTPINDDGTYKVDVSGMTGPFILKAHGTIAGVSVTYFSAATPADVGGTINVTPFTDLLLSSITGKLVNLYLLDESKIPALAASLTAEKINQTQDVLFAKLRPILIKLGVTETIDLIRTVFKADHTGLDALMDLVKVEYNTDTAVATLRNMITQDKMAEINVQQPITVTPIPPSSYEGINLEAANDVKEIGEALKRLENLFARGLPTSDMLANSGIFDTSDNFMQDGSSFQQLADEFSSEPELVGLRFTWSLKDLDPGIKATVIGKYSLKNQNTYQPGFEITELKKINGRWLFSGDNQIADIDIKNEHALSMQLNNQLVNTAPPSIRNGIRFTVDPFAYNNSGRTTPRIEFAEITGLGISNTLHLINTNPYVAMGITILNSTVTIGNALWDCADTSVSESSWPCLNLPAVKLSEPYKIVLKDDTGQPLNGAGYMVPLDRVPLAFNQLTPNQFINITSVQVSGAPLVANSFGPNKSMRVEFSVPADLQIARVDMTTWAGNAVSIQQDYSVPLGATSAIFGWGATLSSGTVSRVYLRIDGYSKAGHKFVTTANIQVPPN